MIGQHEIGKKRTLDTTKAEQDRIITIKVKKNNAMISLLFFFFTVHWRFSSFPPQQTTLPR